MNSLLAEIFEKLFDDITEPQDLRSLRMVSRYFNAVFTPLAFQHVAFTSSPESIVAFNSLAESSVSKWVTNITWTYQPTATTSMVVYIPLNRKEALTVHSMFQLQRT